MKNLSELKTQFSFYFKKFFELVENFYEYSENRFLHRTHLIETKLEVGNKHEYSRKMLYGMFSQFSRIVDEKSNQEYTLFDSDEEISQLYLWWIKKQSKDEMFNNYVQLMEEKRRKNLLTDEEREEYRVFVEENMASLSESFEEETEMLTRLVKLRDRIDRIQC